MTAIFDSTVACCGDIDDRLETLTRAIRAFVDCWAPRVQELEARKDAALAAYGAGHAHAAVHMSRALIEARFEEELDALTREGKKHRRGLDQLADAAFQRKVAGLKRKAQREIFASFGKALDAFSPHWEALDKRHQFERERFERREHTLGGRLLNAARAMPLSDFGEAVSHLRAGLASAQVREHGLASSQGRERNELTLKQRAYRLRLSKPHQDVLDMITVKSAAPAPAKAPVPVPEPFDQLRAKAARKRIALEMVRTMESSSKMMAPPLGSRRTRRAAWEPEID